MVAQADDKKTVRSELLKRYKESYLDLSFVAAEAGDIGMSKSCAEKHYTLKKKRGDSLYTDMLFVLTHQNLPSKAAESLWFQILQHKKELTRQLCRNPGVAVAALDFLSNIGSIDDRIALIQEAKMAHVTEVAIKNGMTGLYDHESFQVKLHEELARYHRQGVNVSLIMGDVDHFKNYNDSHGHKKGDAILEKISDCIKEEIREIDIGARYGGEEFAIIACASDVNEAYQLAERIRKRIKKEFSDTEHITMSFGVADSKVTHGCAADLISAADSALYEAKKQGRNQTVLYKKQTGEQ